MSKYDDKVTTCSNLIYSIIRTHFKGYDIEDLYQVGVIGIMKACDNYKVDKNVKFSTYAYKYIYGEIYAYVNNNKIIKVARESQALYRKVNEAKNILSQKLMREPSIYELSLFLEIDQGIIEDAIASSNCVDSLDRVIYSDGKNISLFDTIKDDKDYYNIDYLLLDEELNKLSEEEKQIIRLRYFEDKSQSEVADILGKSQVGVSRVEQKTLKRIRSNYQNVA